jgi:hypothetical protein
VVTKFRDKLRGKKKKKALIKPINMDSEVLDTDKNEDSECDKRSVFSRKSFIEKVIDKFIHGMYKKELNSRHGLENVLQQVQKLEIQTGTSLTRDCKENLKEQLENDHKPLLVFLHKFKHLNHPTHPDHPMNKNSLNSPDKDQFYRKYGKIYPSSLSEKFQELRKFESDKLSMITAHAQQRRDHLSIFQSLLDYLQYDLMWISKQQSDMFRHQIRTESESLLSAYEVYLKDQNLQEFVETLFIIYQ